MNLLDQIVQTMQSERLIPVKPSPIVQKFSLPIPPVAVTRRRSTCRWIVRIDGKPMEQGWREKGWRERVRTVLAFWNSQGANPTLAIGRYSSQYRTMPK